MGVQHLKQIGKVKKLNKWVPHELTKNKNKKPSFWSVVFSFYSTTMNHISIRLWLMMKSGFYTTDYDQLSGWTAPSTSRQQTCPAVTGWRSAARPILRFPSRCDTASSEKHTQEIDEMHQKLQCLQVAFVDRKGPFLLHATPDHISQNKHFKSWTNWAMKFCLTSHTHLTSLQLTTNSSSILTTFLQEKCFHNPGKQDAESVFQEFIESWSLTFYATGINKFIFHWQ